MYKLISVFIKREETRLKPVIQFSPGLSISTSKNVLLIMSSIQPDGNIVYSVAFLYQLNSLLNIKMLSGRKRIEEQTTILLKL